MGTMQPPAKIAMMLIPLWGKSITKMEVSLKGESLDGFEDIMVKTVQRLVFQGLEANIADKQASKFQWNQFCRS